MNPSAKAFSERLEGALIPAVPVPFDDEGKHREQAEKKIVKYQAEGPAAGVALWVHTGRGLKLSSDERHRVFKRWRIGLKEEQFIVCGAGCSEANMEDGVESLSDAEYISRAAAMAQEAKIYGAEAVLVYAPKKFLGRKNMNELVIDYHESIASAGLPMILFYLYEAAGGISYDMELLSALLTIDSVAGIKVATLDSVMTFQNIAALVKARAPEVALLTGEDRFFGYSVMRGAVGALIGLGAVQPEPQELMLRSWRTRKYTQFMRLSNAIDDLAEKIFCDPMEGYIRRLMIALAAEGVLPMDATYDPWGPPVPGSQRTAIVTALEKFKDAISNQTRRAD